MCHSYLLHYSVTSATLRAWLTDTVSPDRWSASRSAWGARCATSSRTATCATGRPPRRSAMPSACPRPRSPAGWPGWTSRSASPARAGRPHDARHGSHHRPRTGRPRRRRPRLPGQAAPHHLDRGLPAPGVRRDVAHGGGPLRLDVHPHPRRAGRGGPVKPSAEAVLALLQDHPAGITAMDALASGCGDRLAARIHEVKAAGYQVADSWETTPNGARIKRYRLVPSAPRPL